MSQCGTPFQFYPLRADPWQATIARNQRAISLQSRNGRICTSYDEVYSLVRFSLRLVPWSANLATCTPSIPVSRDFVVLGLYGSGAESFVAY